MSSENRPISGENTDNTLFWKSLFSTNGRKNKNNQKNNLEKKLHKKQVLILKFLAHVYGSNKFFTTSN